MASPQQEDAALSPNSIFDDSTSPEPEHSLEREVAADKDTMNTHTCKCGYECTNEAQYCQHVVSCTRSNHDLQGVALMGDEIDLTSPFFNFGPRYDVPGTDPALEQAHLDPDEIPSYFKFEDRTDVPMQDAASGQCFTNTNQPSFLNFAPRSSIPPTSTPGSPRPANQIFDFQGLSDEQFLATDFNPSQVAQNPFMQTAPVAPLAQSDPYLDLHAQNFGYLSQQQPTYGAAVTVTGAGAFPFTQTGASQLPEQPISYPTPTPAAPDLRPPSRSHSILSLSSDIQAVKSAIKSTVKSRGRRRKRPPPDSEDDHSDHRKTKTKKVIIEEGCTVEAAKQRRCRQKKVDNQEALEAEVQKLRAILQNLGGCIEGVQVAGRNWQ